jgi:hypothetical protein
VNQIIAPFGFPKAMKEMASQILIAQSMIKKALRKGIIPKRLRMKKYMLFPVFWPTVFMRASNRIT